MAFEWARRGVKCICLDTEAVEGLDVGAVYTIAEVSIRSGVFKGRTFPQLVCVALEEVTNPNSGDRDGAYALQRFRPLASAPVQQQKQPAPPARQAIRKKELEYA